jgi:hypothetical protein
VHVRAKNGGGLALECHVRGEKNENENENEMRDVLVLGRRRCMEGCGGASLSPQMEQWPTRDACTRKSFIYNVSTKVRVDVKVSSAEL